MMMTRKTMTTPTAMPMMAPVEIEVLRGRKPSADANLF